MAFSEPINTEGPWVKLDRVLPQHYHSLSHTHIHLGKSQESCAHDWLPFTYIEACLLCSVWFVRVQKHQGTLRKMLITCWPLNLTLAIPIILIVYSPRPNRLPQPCLPQRRHGWPMSRALPVLCANWTCFKCVVPPPPAVRPLPAKRSDMSSLLTRTWKSIAASLEVQLYHLMWLFPSWILIFFFVVGFFLIFYFLHSCDVSFPTFLRDQFQPL